MLSLALARAIEIIGEAASKVSPETRAATPFVPWVQVIAMRNRLIHAYFHIDNDIIWKTITEEVPELLLALLTIVPKDQLPLIRLQSIRLDQHFRRYMPAFA